MNGPPPSSFPAFDVSKNDRTDALTVVGLTVTYRMRGRDREVLQDISFRVRRGEAYGLVGKSAVAMAALRYLPRNGKVKAGKIIIAGQDVQKLDAEALRTMRTNAISIVYQDPGPRAEFVAHHRAPGERSVRSRGRDARRSDHAYARHAQARAHRLTRARDGKLSASAFGRHAAARRDHDGARLEPRAADSRRTHHGARRHRRSRSARPHCAVARRARHRSALHQPQSRGDRAHVRTRRRAVCGQARGRRRDRRRFHTPASPLYGRTAALPAHARPQQGHATARHDCGQPAAAEFRHARLSVRGALPPYRVNAAHGDQMSCCHYHERAIELPRAEADTLTQQNKQPGTVPVLRAEKLSKTFHVAGAAVRAVDDVSIELASGETLGLVGKSGSGKTTLAKLMLGLLTLDAGGVLELVVAPLATRVTRRNDEQVKSLQIVLQNPDSALNRAFGEAPDWPHVVASCGVARSRAIDERLGALTAAVLLPERYLGSRTRQLSDGLKQRVAIARAFAGEPRVVVCDEPTSALDVSVQAAILNLLADLQRERGVSYVFISHDLHVMRYLSDRIAVLYLGRLLEIGPAAAVFDGPHPYTEGAAVLGADAWRRACVELHPFVRRSAERGVAAFGLRLSYALPTQDRRNLRTAGSAVP